MQPLIVRVDYNARDRTGKLLRVRMDARTPVEVGEPVIAYEPSEHTELDAEIAYVGPPYAGPVWGERSTDPEPQPWRIVHLRPLQWQVRDMHACTTVCDSDCEEEYCHEGHQVPWKREAGHPWLRIVNGEESVYP